MEFGDASLFVGDAGGRGGNISGRDGIDGDEGLEVRAVRADIRGADESGRRDLIFGDQIPLLRIGIRHLGVGGGDGAEIGERAEGADLGLRLGDEGRGAGDEIAEGVGAGKIRESESVV